MRKAGPQARPPRNVRKSCASPILHVGAVPQAPDGEIEPFGVAIGPWSYLLGVSTRRVERLVETLGITRLSKSQVSQMAKSLDEQVTAFRTRPLDAGPYTFVAADALVLKVREGGRTVNVHALIATGVNGEGYREVLGVQVATSEDGAGWLAFLRDLTARGLSGVKLVTSDAHRGLVDAIGATLPGACWQRSSVNIILGGMVPLVHLRRRERTLAA